jgi:ABC-type Fe3+-hydroxamate transport system substrate-binding protein
MRNVCKRGIIIAVLLVATGVSRVWCDAKPESAVKDSGMVTVTDLTGRQVTLKLPVKKANVNWSGSG